MNQTRILVALLSLGLGVHSSDAKDLNVVQMGAVPNVENSQTQVFQQAIDECSASGGGQVLVPAGTYVVGALQLKSGVELHLSKGATLLGSTNHPEDYQAGRGIITAKNVENCALTGLGTIDGRGYHANFQKYGNNQGNRPHAIFFEDCKNMVVKDVDVKNAAWWTFRLFRCDGVTIDGVKIYSHSIVNNDGLDIDARNVTVSNCRIDGDDDGICMKSDDPNFMVENITITNCIIASNCNPIKFGTSSKCGFRNITVSNCVIHRPSESNVWDWSKEYREVKKGELTGLAGIAVEAVDGGHIENLNFSNISMTGIITPIFVCLNNRNGIGSVKNLVFSGITAKAAGIIPCLISSIPGQWMDGITLRDIVVEHVGNGTEKDAATPLNENLRGYPENRMYGSHNPAYGLYVRHAKNVTIDNFQVRVQNADARPLAVMEDVHGVMVENLKDVSSVKPNTLMRLVDCSDFIIREALGMEQQETILKVEGAESKGIRCEFPFKNKVVLGKEVSSKAVTLK